MDSRGRIPSPHQNRNIHQAPLMLQRGPFHPGQWLSDQLPSIEMLENRVAIQGVEIEQLDGDNHLLEASHDALRLEVADADKEIESFKDYIRSIETDSNAKMSALTHEMAKLLPVVSTCESVKNDLNQAKLEAQNLLNVRQELIVRVQEGYHKLEKAQTGVNTLEVLDEQNKLRREYRSLCASYDHERGVTMEELDKMEETETNLFDMVREIDMLEEKLLNAKKRPCGCKFIGCAYMNLNPYPLPALSGGSSVNGYRQSPLHIGARPPVPETAAVLGSNGTAVHGGPYA